MLRTRTTLFSLFLFLSSALSANEWYTFELDSFSFDRSANIYTLSAKNSTGGAILDTVPPQFPRHFWMLGDLWTDEVSQPDAVMYFFGSANDSLSNLFAAGYSPKRKQIELWSAAYSDSLFHLKYMLVKKSVEMARIDRKLVFKLLFMADRQQLSVEVNGVPMLTDLPMNAAEISRVGYLVENGAAQLKAIRYSGK